VPPSPLSRETRASLFPLLGILSPSSSPSSIARTMPCSRFGGARPPSRPPFSSSRPTLLTLTRGLSSQMPIRACLHVCEAACLASDMSHGHGVERSAVPSRGLGRATAHVPPPSAFASAASVLQAVGVAVRWIAANPAFHCSSATSGAPGGPTPRSPASRRDPWRPGSSRRHRACSAGRRVSRHANAGVRHA
jgi:hypothetical protein